MLPIDLRRFSTAFRFPPSLHFVFPIIHRNKFSYVRKFIFLRKKISPPSNVDFSPSAERKIFVRTEKKFLPQENLFPCGRKNIFLRKEIYFCAHENKFPHMRKYFFVYTEINFLIYGNFTPSKPAGNAGTEEGSVDRQRD